MSSEGVESSWDKTNFLTLSIGSRSCTKHYIEGWVKSITVWNKQFYNWRFRYNRPVLHPKSHHVCDKCFQDQTWSGHGTCRYPFQGSAYKEKKMRCSEFVEIVDCDSLIIKMYAHNAFKLECSYQTVLYHFFYLVLQNLFLRN